MSAGGAGEDPQGVAAQPQQPPPPRARRRAVRREELLDAADTVIRRVGMKASATLIAKEAGVTKPIIYRHFGDLHDLYRALAVRHQDRLTYYLHATREDVGNVDQHAITHAVMSGFFQAIEREPNLFRFLVQAPGGPEDEDGGQSWFVHRFAEQIGVYLAGQEPLSARFRAMGYAAAGAMVATGSWWLEDGTVTRGEAVDALTDMLAAGIPPAGEGAPGDTPHRST